MKRTTLIVACCTLMLTAFCAFAPAAETLVDVSFAEGAWDASDWTMAKSPIVDYFGEWIQRENCIENVTPDDPEKRRALDGTLTTMVYKTPFAGNWTVSATFEIGSGAAPGIVIARDMAPDDQGRPQYGIYYEAIVYEKGINLWYHYEADGKRKWHKALYARFPLQADTPYTLTMQRRGAALDLQVFDASAAEQPALQQVGLTLPTLPDQVYLGIESCEGICRTLDFKVNQ